MTSGINAKNHNKITDITQYHTIIQKIDIDKNTILIKFVLLF